MAGETMVLSGSNGGDRLPAPGVVGSPACSFGNAHATLGQKTPAPSPDAGFAAGGEGGRGAYVHTHRNISPYQFDGRTVDERDRDRNRRRYKTLGQVSWALQQSEDGKEKEVGQRLLA